MNTDCGMFKDAKVSNREGLHARPVMRFVDLASGFQSEIMVMNLSRRGEKLDGKSPMQMMLLEATEGSILRIEAEGPDELDAVNLLAGFIDAGCPSDFSSGSSGN
jgi:phosphotransferase system HPr (HPr) family protein